MKKNKFEVIFLIVGIIFLCYRIAKSVEVDFRYIEYCFFAILISASIYFLSKKILINKKNKYKPIVLIPFFLSIIFQSFILYENISVLIGLLLILLTAIFIFNYYDAMSIKNSTYKGIIPIGTFLGLLGIIRPDMISYMWGLFFWAMFWAGMADVEGLGLSLLKRAIKGLKQGAFLTLIILFVMFFICLFFPFISFEGVIAGIIEPFYKYSEITFPFPANIYGILFYLPILLAISALIVLIYKNRKRIVRANTPLFWKEMLLINLTLNIFNYSLLGNSLSFLLPSILLSTLLFFLLITYNFR